MKRTTFWLITVGAALLLVGDADSCIAAENGGASGNPSADSFKQRRKEAAHRKRRIIFNNDGDDIVYQCKAVTVEELLNARTTALAGSQVDSIFYCTWSSGFGVFTHNTKVGQVFETREAPFTNNPTRAVLDAGIDPLRVMTEFSRKHGIEVFWSLRMNDTHDGSLTEYGPVMFNMNKLKVAHPEYLFGTPQQKPKYGAWSAVDFGRAEVRDLAFRYVEEVCRNYDVDGVELDFFRHPIFFKHNAQGLPCDDEDRAQMTGLLQKYEMREAVIRCLLAGCDLILCRSESPVTKHLVAKVIEAVKEKRYPESKLDQSVQRILALRWEMGLAQNGGKVDAAKAGLPFNDPFVTGVAKEAAEKSVVLLRDNPPILPLKPETKVVLIEQIHHFHTFINNLYSHPGLLWEELRKRSDSVALVLINEKFTEADKAAVHQRLREADYDVIVTTSYYNYRSHATMTDLLPELQQYQKPIIVVSNTPYEKFGIPAGFPTGIVCFVPSGRENLSVVADILYGKHKPGAKLNVRLK